ncbi:glycosyltransferase family 61 protein [Methylobacterium nonmethylotrophicum]|uniref:Glycosyltransferase family 61 protein n=1 Tax=Methylobacterium nonmethylotrophicum TaxID=1141884 RepID=A0A4Z0NNF0_9HYPH|nr:glycosyltransferase family 61 protein [Methylobacterium nonmethylotrophicum]TGD98216.1 glycosyltransferase family 61 protein [Methylobacterium nonmethylotrophicum]
MILQRCEMFYGRAEVREGRPILRVVEEAQYLTRAPGLDKVPAIFDAAGRMVPESLDYYGADRTPFWQTTEWPDGLGPVTEAAPPGTYLYVGALQQHFGHFIINTLARLWPLDDLAGEAVRPTLLCHSLGPTVPWEATAFIPEILGRLGLGVQDLASFDRPMRIPTLLVPQAALQQDDYAFPILADLCRRIGGAYYAPEDVDADPQPVYLSKARLTHGVRRFTNEEAVTALLERNGVRIVFPELLSFPEQVRLFARHRVILGSNGSAFHTLLFAPPGRQVIALTDRLTLSATYQLIDRLTGTQAHYYYPVGTSSHVGDGFSLNFAFREPEAVAGALLDRIETIETLRERDMRADPGSWHLSPTIPPLPQRPGRWPAVLEHLRGVLPGRG